MDDKPIYVSLLADLPSTIGGDQPLVKKIDSEYMSGTVNDIVQKMIDPDKDTMNEAYNANEREMANTVQEWFRMANESPNEYSVGILGVVGKETFPMNLDDKIADPKYESLFQVHEEKNDSGDKERYKLLEMEVSQGLPNGYIMDSMLDMRYEI